MSRNSLVIFSGPPGSGKGSLSHLCTAHLKWVPLSTGNLLRKHIAQGTELGAQMAAAINAGRLVDDQLISAMVGEWLHEQEAQGNSVILDGFPRTVAQAEWLCSLLQDKLSSYALTVVHLGIHEDHIIKRLSARATCENKTCQAVYSLLEDSAHKSKEHMVCDKCTSTLVRRADDEEATVRERLKTYYRHEQALLEYFAQQQIDIKAIPANRSLNDVFEDFKRLVSHTLHKPGIASFEIDSHPRDKNVISDAQEGVQQIVPREQG